jgi:hypothetical protein
MGQFQSLGGVFTSPPEIVPWGEQDRFLIALAVGRDRALWYAEFDGFIEEGGTWSAWHSLEDGYRNVSSACRAVGGVVR